MWSLYSSALNLIVIIVIVIVFYIYKYLIATGDHWKDKGVPFKEPIIGFGNLKEFLLSRATLGEVYSKIYNEFPNEKYVGCFRSRKPDLLLKDPELIKCVLVKDFHHFQERSIGVSTKVDKLSSNLFMVNGAKWKTMRQKMTPLFSTGKIKNMFHLVCDTAVQFQNFLDIELIKNDEQEVSELMAKFTTDVIGSCAFGINMNSLNDSEAPFRKMGKRLMKGNTILALKFIFRFVTPDVFNFLKIRIMEKEAEDFFINSVKDIARERVNGGSSRHDFIDLMLQLKENKILKNGTVEDIEVDDIFMAAQALIFFIAGFETSSGLMTFTLYELAKNVHVQEKVISEIDSVLMKYEGKLCYDAISDMEYLECVISETMRRYPAGGVLPRVCSARYTFPGTKLTINEGEGLTIPVYALHHDPKYFPEPKKFIPERFTSAAKQKIQSMVYLPFGEGPRNCIGLRFGKLQSMIGLVAVLTKYTIHECSKTEKEIIFNPFSVITASKNGVWLKMKPR